MLLLKQEKGWLRDVLYDSEVIKKARETTPSFHGYDYDGVWNEGHQESNSIIITGRSYERAAETLKEMKEKSKYDVAIYFNPIKQNQWTTENIAAWKSEMIKRLGITDFWEDNPTQAKIIEASCPDTKVHLVESKEEK